MAAHYQISNTIWNVANHLRGSWKNYEYQDVILPLTVLKRLDAALEPTKQQALERFNELDGRVSDLRIIRRVTGYDFYNISPFTFKKLLDDQTHISRNLRKYIDGFSDNVKEIFSKFDFEKQLDRLEGSNILYLILQEFDKIELHPDKVPNHEIGLAFEDLIRRFAEQSNETAGEHYTPRDVVRLMTGLIFTSEDKDLSKPGIVKLLYDPACGTGGMLTVGKDYILSHFNMDAKIHLFGQELNSATYAICKADMLLKGENIEHIKGGEREHDKASTLSNDQHNDKKFDYIISNPPYGVEWKKDEEDVKNEARRRFSGRFGAGLPRISDGQLLFLQHIVSKFKPAAEGGSEAVIIFNSSPLFTGDAGGGESEIRRWLLENDLVDTIIALPDALFFNTDIPTFIWILTNRKKADKKGKVQLINAQEIKHFVRKNLGNKRYELSEEDSDKIINIYKNFEESKYSRIFNSTDFGYRKITIQHPLRLMFEITDTAILNLKGHRIFLNDRPSRKAGDIGEKENWVWQKLREDIYISLNALRGNTYKSRNSFLDDLQREFNKRKIIVQNKLIKIIVQQIGISNKDAEICLDSSGNPEPNKELKDYEFIPLGNSITEYFEREVKPFFPHSWIDQSVIDSKDGQIGIVGYEILFFPYFYQYEKPRSISTIADEVRTMTEEISNILNKL